MSQKIVIAFVTDQFGYFIQQQKQGGIVSSDAKFLHCLVHVRHPKIPIS